MKTALMFALAFLGFGGLAVLSLVLVTQATVRLALCGLTAAGSIGLFLYIAFTAPEPMAVYAGMLGVAAAVACAVRALVLYADALDRPRMRTRFEWLRGIYRSEGRLGA